MTTPFSKARAVACGVALTILASSATSFADSPAAQALFKEGQELMHKGDFARACKKLEASQQAESAPGTLFTLAACYEKNGQTASAWATYSSAAAGYNASNRADWEKKARERARALEAKLSKLTINVGEGQEKVVEVKRDGEVVNASQFGTAIPVDPGSHVIEAIAPGKKRWTSTVHVEGNGATESVAIPALEFEPTVTMSKTAATAQPPPSNPEPRESGSFQRPLGIALGAVGIVGLGVGAVTGAMAMGKNSDSSAACPNDGPCRDSQALSDNDSARGLATVSTIGFIGGGVLLVGGAVLFFTAPKTQSTTAASIVPLFGPGAVGMRGTF